MYSHYSYYYYYFSYFDGLIIDGWMRQLFQISNTLMDFLVFKVTQTRAFFLHAPGIVMSIKVPLCFCVWLPENYPPSSNLAVFELIYMCLQQRSEITTKLYLRERSLSSWHHTQSVPCRLVVVGLGTWLGSVSIYLPILDQHSICDWRTCNGSFCLFLYSVTVRTDLPT